MTVRLENSNIQIHVLYVKYICTLYDIKAFMFAKL